MLLTLVMQWVNVYHAPARKCLAGWGSLAVNALRYYATGRDF